MRKATGRVGGSYSYNFACEVCGIVYKREDIRKRWDGLNVCEYDWEPRQPLDFFRTIPDTHVLDIVGRDQTNSDIVDLGQPNAIGWTPIWTNTSSSSVNVVFNAGNSKKDSLSSPNTRTLTAIISIPFGENIILATGLPTGITLPDTPITAGTFTLMTNKGKLLASGAIQVGTTALTVVSTQTKVIGFDTITFSGKYGL